MRIIEPKLSRGQTHNHGIGRAQDSPWLSSGFTIAELKVAAMEFERVDELGIQRPGLALSSEITAVKECRYGKDTCGQENCVIEERIVEKIVMDKILLWFMDECIVYGWVSREYVCGYVMDECIVDGVS
ncbi:hypothetical protein DY000_02005446 [Brassica cretica]|uniref:Uncharacterized protein n=1 Tax=Brassica cretica TaxID=69181 RepID=A0ABQ7BWV2_BRACR|nr:hypothetical protein DY000_02005446 [Brassica cretica]